MNQGRHFLCQLTFTILITASALFAQRDASRPAMESVTQAIKQGRLAEAEGELRGVLKRFPSNVRALELMGVVLDGEQRYPEAEGYYLKALRGSPHSASILNNLGNHYMARELPEKARAAYLQAIAVDREIANANLHLAAFYVEDGDGENALRCLERLPRRERDEPSVLILRAQALFQLTGDRSRAEAILARLESTPKMDAGTAFSVGMVYVKLKDYAKAESAFTRALERAPGSDEVLYNLGLAAFHAGHLAAAQRDFETLLRRRPGDADGMLALARVYLKQGNATQAAVLLYNAEKLAPSSPDVFTLEAQAAEKLGFYGDTVTAYDNYLRLRPSEDWARRERGFALARTGQWAKGLEDLRRYVANHPNDAVGLYEGGVAEAILNHQKGLEQLTRAVSADPEFLAARVARGELYHRMGRYNEALNDLDLVVQRDPENVVALDLLGVVYLALGRPEEARSILAKASGLAPRNPTVLTHYSRTLFRAGKKDEAMRVEAMLKQLTPFERGQRPHEGLFDYLGMSATEQRRQYLENLQRNVNANPQNATLRILLGKELLREGKSAEALQTFRPVLNLSSDPKVLTDCGETLLQAEQYSLAREFLQSAAEGDPSLLAARLGLGVAVFHLEGPDAGLKEIDRISPRARTSDYYLLRAQILDAEDKNQEASEALNAAYQLFPRQREVYLQAAGFLIKHQHYQQALDALNVAAQVLPDDPQIMLTRAITLELLVRTREAERLLDEIRSRWPEWYEPYLTQGIILENELRSSDSKSLLESAIALGAQEPLAYYYLALATLHATPDDLETAQQAINQALGLDPTDPYIRSLAGKIALQRKDYPAAIENLTRALQAWPDMLPARQTLLATYRAMGDMEKANEESKAILRILQENPRAGEELPPLAVGDLFGVRLPQRNAGSHPDGRP